MMQAVHPGGEQALNAVQTAAILWSNKWLLIIVTLLSAIASLVYAFTATEWYRADIVLKPADSKQTQGLLSQLGGGLGGLASLAGLNLNDNKSSESIAVLKSRELIGAFIQDQNLLPILFAQKWDAAAQRWKSSDPKKQPDVRDGVRYFTHNVFNVEEDKKNGLVSVIVEWKDPVTAAAWANMLVERVNDTMRNRALALSEYNVNYLKQEMAASAVVTMQQSIGRVMESELQKLLLAKADKEYAFKILDHAQAPRLREWPKRTLIVCGATLLGLIAAGFFVVYRHVIRRDLAAGVNA